MMEQLLGARMIVDTALIVVTMTVLAWFEARRGERAGGSPIARPLSHRRRDERLVGHTQRAIQPKGTMKLLAATTVALGTAALVTTASAHVVEITTSIPAAKAADDTELREALATAIDDAVKHAIGFVPTFITLQNARLVGGRIYIVVLVADESGEALLNQLAADEASSPPEPLHSSDEAEKL